MSDQSTVALVVYKDIPGFTGYRAGDDGSIWSCWKKEGLGYGGGSRQIISSEWKLKIPRVVRRRPCVSIRNQKGKQVTMAVSHLVLLAFKGPRPNGMEACHDPDRNTLNNAANNLRWDTHKENVADKKKHGTYQCGEKNPFRKLTEVQVAEIRQKYNPPAVTYADLADLFGVRMQTIVLIVKRKTWVHI